MSLCHSRPWPRHQRPVPGLFASLLWHLAVILWLIRWPFASLFHSQAMTLEGSHVDQVVYILRGQNLLDYLPLINAQGVPGRPGQGSQPPDPGKAPFDSDLTVQSDPPQPDNIRQTIVQISSPPRLRIPRELRLPNALIGAATLPPPPPIKVEPKAAPGTSGGTIAEPSNTSISNPAATTAPAFVPPAAGPVPDPALPLSQSATLTAQPAPPTMKGEITDLGSPNWMGAAQLLSLSVDPAPAADSLTVPPGNRFGTFSISPGARKDGSPGDLANADARDGSRGDRAAEESGTGHGSVDHSSAGRDGIRLAAGVSVAGGGILPPSASDLVYPVSPPHPHRPAVVVTTGPTGGGGLHLYGVLKGDKIYTIYLPMPGRSWVLQFCEHDHPTEASHRPLALSNGVEIRLDPALVPPSALEQYDFQRPPFSKPLAGTNGMIILNGIIREDGAVGDLKILQGILDSVDQAALAAFSRWRFIAALRSDKPVAVDVLVGIPMVSSGT